MRNANRGRPTLSIPTRVRDVGALAPAVALCLGFLAGLAPPAFGQEGLDDVFGNLGTARAEEASAAEAETGAAGAEPEPQTAAPAQPDPGMGSVRGQVFDAETGSPVQRATVILVWPVPDGGGESRQEVQLTDFFGAFEFPSVPPGAYTLEFIKAGYRTSKVTDVAVEAGAVRETDFPLPPVPSDTAGQVLQLDPFVVEESQVGELMASLELRMEADELLNIMSAEDFSKFAAGDVAEALKRVAGVNVVEGKFAIIRGLEDRYSSTVYNSAPVPSPDPDKQSVQLDLFPSDVVGNLVVSKTFAGRLPSNSSGGSIDIVTHEYPEDIEIKLSGGTGFNANARDRFVEVLDGSSIGRAASSSDVLESDTGLSVGGRRSFAGREFRFKGVLNRELDFETKEGFQESREPRAPQRNFFGVVESGDLSLGELSLSGGRFDLTESERSEQRTSFGAFGFGLDEEGLHRIDASLFYTQKDEETVQIKERGFLPNFDYSVLADKQANGQEIDANADFDGFATLSAWLARKVRGTPSDPSSRGPLWYTSFFESTSFEQERDLRVLQVNGSHELDWLEGLRLRWAWNRAETTQDELARGTRFFFEPEDENQIPTEFPTQPDLLGSGEFAANNGVFFSENDVKEWQDFLRFDADYERSVFDWLSLQVSGGLWRERADRDVTSSFLESPTVNGSSQFAVLDETPQELGLAIFNDPDAGLDQDEGSLAGLRDTANESSREIDSWYLESKLTFWDRVDLVGGFRREKIVIESLNDAFIGEIRFGAEETFPSRFLFFDRLDNPALGEVIAPPPSETFFNDQLLNIDVPIDPDTGLIDLQDEATIGSLINGRIDEYRTLPAAGIAVRPIEGMSIRGAFSKTVARPSFREMGYYVTVEPGTDDLVVGNPQLQLSDVESWDARVEYTWGDFGDLLALSVFRKRIEDPIESIVVRNPLNAEGSSSALFRTFFNNPNEASLRGLEVEGQKSLDFLGLDFLSYLSLGGNVTYIDAEVDRTEAELARSESFFGTAPGDAEEFSELEESRRLFGQPEWIANADLTFDHPDWGTKITLAFFAISDVLDAAGAAFLNNNNNVTSFTLDRYVDDFHQLDLIVSQTWRVEALRGDVTLKGSVKNLTDSRRRILFDPEQTRDEIPERSFQVGRDYSISISYEWSF